MKNNQVFSMVVICTLLSCTNNEQTLQHKGSDASIITKKMGDSQYALPTKELATVETDTSNYEYKYFFSNDTISQILYIKKGIVSKKYQVPEKVEFKLILTSKFENYIEKRIEGIAILANANETFSEKNNINEGDYFAADYTFSLKECELTIRLDIDNYAACIVSTTCIDMKGFLKSYPDYDIMKRTRYSPK
ncbi:MAG: hypothetical protein J0I09_14900 [Sphingobacteriia bacterium]|nr:hypothetical protein [Sphingobacteriia bacterium]